MLTLGRDDTHFVFPLEQPHDINHLTVFLLGTSELTSYPHPGKREARRSTDEEQYHFQKDTERRSISPGQARTTFL